MNNAAGKIEIFLQPGDVYFGDSDERIRTLLGSCVSITAWHPRLRIGGMCHYMLAKRGGPGAAGLDGKYAEDAGLWFLGEFARNHSNPRDYEFKIFGGGEMFATGNGRRSVGRANVQHGLEMLERAGCRVVARHLGGSGHRTLVFDIETGEVWMRHVPLADTRQGAVAA
jgi:chemotaxis protein CheD